MTRSLNFCFWWTKEKGRSSGGSRFSATRVPSRSSFWMVAWETTETPIPASTAPFTASGLPSSMAILMPASQFDSSSR